MALRNALCNLAVSKILCQTETSKYFFFPLRHENIGVLSMLEGTCTKIILEMYL